MYVKVKNAMNGETCMLTVSKLTSVLDFRSMILDKMNVKPEQQRLFYQGKQLEDEHTMYDYSIKVNDVIQLMVRQVLGDSQSDNLPKSPKKVIKENMAKKPVEVVEKADDEGTVTDALSDHYKIGDPVDILDLEETGGIFEARVTRITKDTTADCVKKSRPRDQDELRSSQLVVLSLGIAWKGFTRWREKNVCWQTDVLV